MGSGMKFHMYDLIAPFRCGLGVFSLICCVVYIGLIVCGWYCQKMEEMSSQLRRLNGLMQDEATVTDRCVDLLKKLRRLESEEQSIRAHRAQEQRGEIVPWLGTA
jgi:hypothetical protein